MDLIQLFVPGSSVGGWQVATYCCSMTEAMNCLEAIALGPFRPSLRCCPY
jgi:hypothetical protein